MKLMIKKIVVGVIAVILVINSEKANGQSELGFSRVVGIDSTDKDQLFTKGLLWFAETFKDSKAVIELKERESGLIVGKGLLKYSASSLSDLYYGSILGHIKFTVKVSVKNEKVRIELDSFIHEPSNAAYSLGLITDSENYPNAKVPGWGKKWHQAAWEDLQDDVKSNAAELMEDFKSYMQSDNSLENDW